MPAETELPETPQVIDFFYSIFLMMLLGMVILGSFTFMTLGRTSYLQALTNTVFLIAGSIFVLGLAWNPRTGYAGLNVFFSRYLFSIGLPVEKWLHFLAKLSQQEARPERFVAEGVAGLARLPWIAGAAWDAAGQHGESGARTDYLVEYGSEELSLTIFSRYRTSPALQWHMHLLGQLLGEFYSAKLREQKLRQASYLQAVHETGARLTHDVKNLLQSLNVLCSIAGQEDSPQSQALIRRQLPAITQRLSATLEKLQHPGDEEARRAPLREWWAGLRRQYQDQDIEFTASGEPAIEVPKALFDGVADNLLQNALAKRRVSDGVRIRVLLNAGIDAELRVCDSGKAIPRIWPQSACRACGLGNGAGHRALPGGTPRGGERLCADAGGKSRRRGVLPARAAARRTRLGQDAGRDQAAVQFAVRDPGELVVELAVRRGTGCRRVEDEEGVDRRTPAAGGGLDVGGLIGARAAGQIAVLPGRKITTTTRPVDMIWLAPLPPQLGGLPEGVAAGEAVTDLQISRSFGLQEMPLAFRFVALVKCGSVEVPEQLVTVRATA